MPTDKAVYFLLKAVPQAFFTLIGRNPADAERYEFKSVELKELALRLDGVYAPIFLDDFIYFVEAQFYPDSKFYERFFAEIFLYLKQYGAVPWRAVVIFPSKSVEPKSLEGYQELFESGRVLRVYLNELPDVRESESLDSLFRLLIEPEPTVVPVAKLLQRAPEQLELSNKFCLTNFQT